MQPKPPVTIRKSLVGLLGILFIGLVLAVLLIIGAIAINAQGNTEFAYLLLAAAGLTALATAIQAYVYSLSRIMLGSENLTVINWTSLVSSNNNECEWNQVQDINVSRGGIFPLIFGYGTLLIQTAGTQPNLRFTYTPNVEHWQQAMRMMADTAVQPVRES